MTIQQLLRAATRTTRTAETLSDRFALALGDVLRATERRLVPLVTEAAEGRTTAIVRAAQANRTRTQIREALTEAGYDLLVSEASASFDQMVASVLNGRTIAELSADLTPRLEGRLDALKVLYEMDLLDEGDQVARALWKATVRGVFSARPPKAILDDLGKIIDRSQPQIATLYDTSVSIFGRQVEALKAGDDPETRFAYVGPVDDVMRPFCRKHVGKVYSRAEIDALDNGQLGNVFLTGGGYNCRHTFHEISRFSELWPLGDPPKGTIPDVQDDLNELRRAA